MNYIENIQGKYLPTNSKSVCIHAERGLEGKIYYTVHMSNRVLETLQDTSSLIGCL